MSHIDFEEVLEVESIPIGIDVTDMLLVMAVIVCIIKLIQSLR
jgi:hypothetical protein